MKMLLRMVERVSDFCLVCTCLLDGFATDILVTAMVEQESDERDPLVSVEQPLLETSEGKKKKKSIGTYCCGYILYNKWKYSASNDS